MNSREKIEFFKNLVYSEMASKSKSNGPTFSKAKKNIDEPTRKSPRLELFNEERKDLSRNNSRG